MAQGTIRVTWSTSLQPEGKRRFLCVWDDPVFTPRQAVAGSGFGVKLIGTLIEKKWYGSVTLLQDPHFSITLDVPLPA